ncbi:MAG: hypothetical protein JW716_05205 [Candidatus Aenigmarchaeota archaeon]|nr:hypothetical protein [Candidatus Aenigmarchaeota archaeon]
MKKIIFIMVLIGLLIMPGALAEPILKIEFDISNEGSVSDFSAVVMEGRPLPKNEGNLMVMIQDSKDNVLWDSGYDLDFYIYDAAVMADEMRYTDKIPYSSNMDKMTVIYNGVVIFSSDLDICDDNGACEGNENSLSCPSDCLPYEEDNLCIGESDGVCDPDCLEGFDPDCIAVQDSCGDGECDTKNNENFASCPKDCSGSADGVCDKQKDGMCDPDCEERDDKDCQVEEEANPFIFPVVVLVIIVIILVAFLMSYRKAKEKQQPDLRGGVQYVQ